MFKKNPNFLSCNSNFVIITELSRDSTSSFRNMAKLFTFTGNAQLMGEIILYYVAYKP